MAPRSKGNAARAAHGMLLARALLRRHPQGRRPWAIQVGGSGRRRAATPRAAATRRTWPSSRRWRAACMRPCSSRSASTRPSCSSPGAPRSCTSWTAAAAPAARPTSPPRCAARGPTARRCGSRQWSAGCVKKKPPLVILSSITCAKCLNTGERTPFSTGCRGALGYQAAGRHVWGRPHLIARRGAQPVDALMGGVDASVLERMAKIMAYMRPTAAGKRLKRKDKLRMLGLAGPENGAPRASLAAAAPATPVRTQPFVGCCRVRSRTLRGLLCLKHCRSVCSRRVHQTVACMEARQPA